MKPDFDWLDRSVNEDFFTMAGHHSKERIIELYKEIPTCYKPLAYAILNLVSFESNMSCVKFRSMLYLIHVKCKEDGVDLLLPYYWYADGVMIPPEYIVRITNGIVGWVCDDSNKKCHMENDCIFWRKE